MAFSYQINQGDEYLTITLNGKASKSDLKGVLDAVTVDGKIMHPKRLWDIRGCELDIAYDDWVELAGIAQSRDPNTGRGAVLVAKDVAYGQLRIYQAFRESESNDVRVFRDEHEAIDWIIR